CCRARAPRELSTLAPTRRSSDLDAEDLLFPEDLADRVVEIERGRQITADRLFDDDAGLIGDQLVVPDFLCNGTENGGGDREIERSEEHTSELQSREKLVCRLLLE